MTSYIYSHDEKLIEQLSKCEADGTRLGQSVDWDALGVALSMETTWRDEGQTMRSRTRGDVCLHVSQQGPHDQGRLPSSVSFAVFTCPASRTKRILWKKLFCSLPTIRL